jgi:DNA-binding transcriptional MerR regulator
MDKSPDAFRTISEVAEDIDVPQHVLRFWETRFSQIKPLKRGGGRRYYRPDDIDLLRGIRHLLYGEGYTIKGVQRILKEESTRFVQSIGRGDERAPTRPSSIENKAGKQEDVGDTAAPAEEGVPHHQGTPGRIPAHATTARHASQASLGKEPDGPLDPRDIARLKAALGDLAECERVLKNLSSLDEPSGSDDALA